MPPKKTRTSLAAGLLVAVAGLLLLGAKGCNQTECEKLKTESVLICELGAVTGAGAASSAACDSAVATYNKQCPSSPLDPCVGKTPICKDDHSVECWEKQSTERGVECVYVRAPQPPPPIEKCPEGQHLEGGVCVPNAPPTPTCKPTEHLEGGVCVPNPEPPGPPPGPSCPAVCPENAKTISAKCAQYQCGPNGCKCTTDSSPRCGDIGDGAAYCAAVTGDPAIRSCKASPEGSPYDLVCNRDFLGTTCPIWQWSIGPNGPWARALPDGIDENGNPREGGTKVSIDHLDGWSDTPGLPYTGKCEKATFGLHAPYTGFGGVVHGGPDAYVRSCTKDGKVCSNPVGPINY